MSRLTEIEIESLGVLAASLPFMNSKVIAAERRAGQAFGDVLRTDMGDDVDDVPLGRALLHIGTFVGRVADCREMDTLANTFLLAALEMTALERGQNPQSF